MLCATAASLLFLLIPNCCALKNTKCVGKKIDKKIFFDILIKVGLKSREKIEKQGIISCYCPNKRKNSG